MERRLPHHLLSRYGCKRAQVAMVPEARLHSSLQYGASRRPRQCTGGTIKPLVESLASRSDDRRPAQHRRSAEGRGSRVLCDTRHHHQEVHGSGYKPATTNVAIVDISASKTSTEAETGMKTMKVCTSDQVVTRERGGCGHRRRRITPGRHRL